MIRFDSHERPLNQSNCEDGFISNDIQDEFRDAILSRNMIIIFSEIYHWDILGMKSWKGFTWRSIQVLVRGTRLMDARVLWQRRERRDAKL